MSDSVDMSVDFAGLRTANPVFTASGTCGYADELADFMDINALGGFITKSITLKPRQGNNPPRMVETDAGMLNAIGLANIGVEEFISEKVPLLAGFSAQVFVNVAGESIDEYAEVVKRLSVEEAISGVEINVSCPNVKKGGIEFGKDAGLLSEVVSAAKEAAGEKVLMVKLSPNVTDVSELAGAAVDAGADALSLVNTFLGMAVDIKTCRCVLANKTGGLSGPAIKPMALYMVNKVYEEVARSRGVAILGMGGIRTASDVVEFMLAGASAVAVGSGNLVKPGCATRIVEGIGSYCEQTGLGNVRDLTGALVRIEGGESGGYSC